MHVIGNKPLSSGWDSEPKVSSLNGLARKQELNISPFSTVCCECLWKAGPPYFHGHFNALGCHFSEEKYRKSVLLIIFHCYILEVSWGQDLLLFLPHKGLFEGNTILEKHGHMHHLSYWNNSLLGGFLWDTVCKACWARSLLGGLCPSPNVFITHLLLQRIIKGFTSEVHEDWKEYCLNDDVPDTFVPITFLISSSC